MHLVPALPELLGAGEAARPGADDADGGFALAHRHDRLDPALVERVVGHEALDRADGDALEALLDHAIAFAETVLRADAAADLREVVGGRRHLVGLVEAVLGGELQPVGNVVRQRAMHRAERHAALGAAARLHGRFAARELAVDLIEIDAAFAGRTLVGLLLRHGNEPEHGFRHRGSLHDGVASDDRLHP